MCISFIATLHMWVGSCLLCLVRFCGVIPAPYDRPTYKWAALFPSYKEAIEACRNFV
jgi:hypothetical protein